MKKIALSLFVLTFFAAPVIASTVPRIDFQKGQTIVSVGIPDLSVDYAINDRLSVGASMVSCLLFPANGVSCLLPPSPYAASLTALDGVPAVRTTYRLGDSPGRTDGLTFSLGAASNIFRQKGQPILYQPWYQAAFDTAFHLDEKVTLRGTLGLTVFDWMWFFPFPWVNAELAFRIDDHNEFTLGGNGLAGWRGVF